MGADPSPRRNNSARMRLLSDRRRVVSYVTETRAPIPSFYPAPPLPRALRFLVVDDSRAVRRLIRSELEPIGAQVAEADCGLRALELAREFNPDAITMDVMMPDVDGYSICERLKSDDFTMAIPVVIVASRPTKQERVRAFLAGAAEYFDKPFPPGALRLFMEQLIRKVRAHRVQRVHLAIDDPAEVLRVESALAAHGYAYQRFDDPKAAVDSLSRECDLLVLDLDYANNRSFEALLSIRDRASVERLPIMALTGNTDRLRIGVAFNAGARDVLRRPFYPEELVARVEHQLQLAQLERRLVEEATVDPLTGLFNRRQLNRLVSVELKRAARHREPLGVLIADLDHFKQVNDTHGHLVGDEVLKACAIEMARHTRATDVLARYGGEEFVFLAPGDREVGLKVVAERIRGHMESLPISTTHGPMRVTVSLGGTWWEPEARHRDLGLRDLLAPADEALYAAKNAGRNRCEVMPSHQRFSNRRLLERDAS
jgi:two-component system cell cycle response regulator